MSNDSPSIRLLVVDDHRMVRDDEPLDVPEDKLRFNGLSCHSQSRVEQGMLNARRVAKLLQDHEDPMLDKALGALLKARYLSLKAQGIEPDEIDSGHCPALSRPRELAERLEAYRLELDGRR